MRSSLVSGVLSQMGAVVVPPALPAIVQTGDPVLRQRAADVAPEAIGSPEMQRLIASMVEVMRAAPGVGLAAPQIGVSLRVIVVEDRADYQAKLDPEKRRELERTAVPLRVFVNPTLRLIGEARATFFEGCLSVAGYTALVERALEVELEGLDEKGEQQIWSTRGWAARILQHECDHLDGTLYLDRMLTRSFATVENLGNAAYQGNSIDNIRRLLHT